MPTIGRTRRLLLQPIWNTTYNDVNVPMECQPIESMCEGDEAAVAEATQYLDGHDLEVWNGARLVKRISAKDA
jgi:hypothetical protein